MNTYKLNWKFAPGQAVKLTYKSTNNLTDAYLKLKFEGIKRKFKEDRPELFTEEYQSYRKEIWDAKEKAHEMKMCDYVDQMFEGKKNDLKGINEAISLLEGSFQFN